MSEKNPRRVAAGRENRKKRGPLTPAGRQRLREAALRNKPWLKATGPTTPEGKKQVAANGRQLRRDPRSARSLRATVRADSALAGDLVAWRRLLHEITAQAGEQPQA